MMIMNDKIQALQSKLKDAEINVNDIENQLQEEYNQIFNDDKVLSKAVTDTFDSKEYTNDEYGDILSWTRFYELKNYKSCKEYLETWMIENHSITVDWVNDTLMYNQGDDNLVIQDDSRHKRDNGVWQAHKLVIPESDYTNEDGEVDTDKRNELIEAYMEKTGYFPGVFRIDYHGNIFAVNTQKK